MSGKLWRIGLDIGSTASKGVIVAPDGGIAAMLLEPTGVAPMETARRLGAALAVKTDGEKPRVVATGYGRALVEGADKAVTEITCHARGVWFLHPDARSLLDIGGQDAKAIRFGAGGSVEDFAMNDRCAAGTGSFLEVMAGRFSLDVGGLSAFCGDDPGYGESGMQPPAISSTCVVFAESEIVGLMARGTAPVEALRAVHRAIAQRAALLLAQVKPVAPLYFSGGVAKNETLRLALCRELGMEVARADKCQFAGAIGAALSN